MKLLDRIQQIDKALSKLAATANSINRPSQSESSLTTMSKSDLRKFVINEIIPIIKSQMRFQQ